MFKCTKVIGSKLFPFCFFWQEVFHTEFVQNPQLHYDAPLVEDSKHIYILRWSAFSYLSIWFVFYMATSTLVISILPIVQAWTNNPQWMFSQKHGPLQHKSLEASGFPSFTIQNIIKVLENCWIHWILLANKCLWPLMIIEISWLRNQNFTYLDTLQKVI